MAERYGWEWHLDWKSALVTALMLPVLVGLGFWQLARAEEKAQMVYSAESRRQSEPVPLSNLLSYDNYQPVTATGQFDRKRYWLLDNRIVNGQFGYEVVAVFTLSDGRNLLVHRGWIPGSRNREVMPEVAIPQGEMTVQGEIYVSPDKPFSLGDVASSDSGWPRRVQWLQVADAQGAVENLVPTMVMLSESSPAAFRTKPVSVNVSPQKHRGYAFQWFAMSAALLVIFLLRNSNLAALIRRRKVN